MIHSQNHRLQTASFGTRAKETVLGFVQSMAGAEAAGGLEYAAQRSLHEHSVHTTVTKSELKHDMGRIFFSHREQYR